MADEEKTEAAEGAPEEGKPDGPPPKKKMMILGGVIAAQVALVLVLGQFLIKPMFEPADGGEVVEEQVEEERGTIMMLDDITVNLKTAKRSRFLRMTIGLELADPAAQTEIEERKPEIRDIVITSVSGREVEQLISIEGKEVLKGELKERINGKLQNSALMNVYFSDFVVQ